MKRAPRDCPCHSGLRYAACCGPFHAGAEPPTPEAMMRSRYSAFALGRGEYLLRTLTAEHGDRDLDAATLVRSRENQRFLDLCILHISEQASEAEVLFYARIFERGVDQSFLELSTFRKEHGGWRYDPRSQLIETARLPPDPRKVTKDQFLALVR